MNRRKSSGNMLGIALIALGLVALGGLGAASLLLRTPPIAPDTLCRTDVATAAHTIILVDATDRLEPRHRRKLRAVLAQERARLQQYDRLTVVRLNVRRPQEPARLFSRCLPRPPELANPLFENTRQVGERWETDFAAALEAALRSAQSGGTARASPIVASLRAVAADPDFGPEVARRRLILISDLLEHDPRGYSHYVSQPEYSGWAAVSPTGPPDLSGVEVRLVPLDRPEHAARQAEAMRLFWPAFFDASGVRSLQVDPAA